MYGTDGGLHDATKIGTPLVVAPVVTRRYRWMRKVRDERSTASNRHALKMLGQRFNGFRYMPEPPADSPTLDNEHRGVKDLNRCPKMSGAIALHGST